MGGTMQRYTYHGTFHFRAASDMDGSPGPVQFVHKRGAIVWLSDAEAAQLRNAFEESIITPAPPSQAPTIDAEPPPAASPDPSPEGAPSPLAAGSDDAGDDATDDLGKPELWQLAKEAGAVEAGLSYRSATVEDLRTFLDAATGA